jgi:hypothetical protein
METQVEQLLKEVLSDAKFFAAFAAFTGVIAGSIITIIGNVFLHFLKERPVLKKEKTQKNILHQMLDDNRYPDKWRRIEVLSAVIGENEEKTKQLLIDVAARGYEKDGELWGLIKNHPLDKMEIMDK